MDRARLALEGADGSPPPVDTPAGALWLFLVVSQANRALDAHRLDDAERTYLDIQGMLANQPESPQQRRHLATTYHQLGMVAELRGRLDDAEQWYRRSLAIKEQLGDRPGMAASYHQLGMVAQLRGRLDDAEQWYRRSLAIKEQLGNRPGMATSYHQLGLLSEERGKPVEALEWMVRCVTLFEEFPHPATGPGPGNLAVLTARLGMETLEDCWRRVTGEALPETVRSYVTAAIAERGGAGDG